MQFKMLYRTRNQQLTGLTGQHFEESIQIMFGTNSVQDEVERVSSRLQSSSISAVQIIVCTQLINCCLLLRKSSGDDSDMRSESSSKFHTLVIRTQHTE
jgi:hypothetical protein